MVDGGKLTYSQAHCKLREVNDMRLNRGDSMGGGGGIFIYMNAL